MLMEGELLVILYTCQSTYAVFLLSCLSRHPKFEKLGLLMKVRRIDFLFVKNRCVFVKKELKINPIFNKIFNFNFQNERSYNIIDLNKFSCIII